MQRRDAKIPMAVKLGLTAFVAVLVPYYWVTYSPWNFLFFCDMALLITLAALRAESPLLVSLPAVGILVPQMLWLADLLSGSRIVGMTGYMFDAKLPLFVRGLSSFHGWLPFLLVWGVWRLGYDRRAIWGWTIIGTGLLVIVLLRPRAAAPSSHPSLAVNLNYVYGLSDQRPQTWMAPGHGSRCYCWDCRPSSTCRRGLVLRTWFRAAGRVAVPVELVETANPAPDARPALP